MPTVGELVKDKAITREDVEKAAARVFDGKTVLELRDGHALVPPDFERLSPHAREAITTALLLAKAQDRGS
jgi:hypothetical protein